MSYNFLQPLWHRVATLNSPLLVNEVQHLYSEGTLDSEQEAQLEHSGIASMIACPIRRNHEVVGLLFLLYPIAGSVQPHQLDTLASVTFELGKHMRKATTPESCTTVANSQPPVELADQPLKGSRPQSRPPSTPQVSAAEHEQRLNRPPQPRTDAHQAGVATERLGFSPGVQHVDTTDVPNSPTSPPQCYGRSAPSLAHDHSTLHGVSPSTHRMVSLDNSRLAPPPDDSSAGATKGQADHLSVMRTAVSLRTWEDTEKYDTHRHSGPTCTCFYEDRCGSREPLLMDSKAIAYELSKAALLQAIIRQLRESLDPQDALQTASHMLADSATATYCFIRQLPAPQYPDEVLMPAIFSSPPPLPPELLELVRSEATSIASSNGAGVRSATYMGAREGRVVLDGSVGSVLTARTMYHGRCNGIIGLVRADGCRWREDERSLLVEVADHVGLAIAHARYHFAQHRQQQELSSSNAELRAALHRADVLRAIVSQIRDTIDTDSILAATARLLGQELGAARCVIRSFPELSAQKELVVHNRSEYDAPGVDPIDPKMPPYILATALVLMEAKEAFINVDALAFADDVNKTPVGREEAVAWLRKERLVSISGGNTFYRGRVNGALILHFVQPRPFTRPELDLLNTALQHVGIALEHARLLRKEQEQREQLTVKNAALEAATLEAQTALRSKSEFLSVITHELRTPLTAVLGITQLLLDTPLNTQQRDYCATIINSGSSLIDLIGELLDCARMKHGSLELEWSVFSFEELLVAVMDLMAPVAAAKGLFYTYSLAADVPDSMYSDPRRLRQTLINLIGNAIKFTDAGEVTVQARVEPGPTLPDSDSDPPSDAERPPLCLCVAISDTGPGIASEDKDRLFKYLQQLDSSKSRRHSGTGIGLYVSKKLTTLMGGDLWVDSTPGVGSTFHLRLPLVPPPAPPPLAVQTDTPSTSPDEPHHARPPSPATSLPANAPPPNPPALPLGCVSPPRASQPPCSSPPQPHKPLDWCRVLLAVPHRVSAAMLTATAESLGALVLPVTATEPFPPPAPSRTDIYVYSSPTSLPCQPSDVHLSHLHMPSLRILPSTLAAAAAPSTSRVGAAHLARNGAAVSRPTATGSPSASAPGACTTPSLTPRPAPALGTANPAAASSNSTQPSTLGAPPSNGSEEAAMATLHQPVHRAAFLRALLSLAPTPAPRTASPCTATAAIPIPMASPSTADAAPTAPAELLAVVPKLKILLAEDHEVNARIVGLMLKKLGHQFDVVPNGRRAVDAVLNKDYHLVLMDWMMPELDGLSACQEIISRIPDERQRPMLVMLTANASDADRQACLSAKVNGYLTKPVRLEELKNVSRTCAASLDAKAALAS